MTGGGRGERLGAGNFGGPPGLAGMEALLTRSPGWHWHWFTEWTMRVGGHDLNFLFPFLSFFPNPNRVFAQFSHGQPGSPGFLHVPALIGRRGQILPFHGTLLSESSPKPAFSHFQLYNILW